MPSSGRKVLLADGDTGLLGVLGRVLDMEGWDVHSLQDGVDLIGRALTEEPSLVVCGYFLPGLGGLRVCRYLKSEPVTAHVPFVLLVPGLDGALRLRADWAGVDRVVELPVRPEAFASVCEELTSGRPHKVEGLSSMATRPPGREAILDMLCLYLEDRVNRLEATWKLTEELGRTLSVRDIFRRLVNGVLAGLGFDRVWVSRYVSETDELVTESCRGRNLSGVPDSIYVREHADLPAGLAIRELRQVRAVDLDLPEERLWWEGTIDYVDTPLFAARRAIGLIRCDRSVSGRRTGRGDLEALRHIAAHTSEAILNATVLQEVTEEREQMSAIMDSLEAGILVVDGSGMLIRVNRRAREMFGRNEEELLGRELRQALPVLSGGDTGWERAMGETAQVTESIVRVERHGPEPSFVLNVSYIPFRRGGHFAGVVLMAEDVTEGHALRESLRRRNEELEAISVIGREMNSSQDLDEICRKVLEAVRRFFPDEAVSVLMTDGRREEVVPDAMRAAVTAGYDAEQDPRGARIMINEPGGLEGIEEESGEYTKGAIATAVASGRVVNVRDAREDERYVENLRGTRSELVVPMMVQDRVVGAIDIQSTRRARFTPESERTVKTLANHAATAVENAVLNSRILEMAKRDRLTGLGNLRLFEEKLEEELLRTRRSNMPFSLIMMDIDDFKHYNDSWGHPMGNSLLRTVVRAMESAIREVDQLIRYGGEEFVCILPFTGEREAAEVAERIRKAVVQASEDIPHAGEQPLGMVSISLGVSTFLTDVGDPDLLLRYADQRMYIAKSSGKNRVVAPSLGNCQFAT